MHTFPTQARITDLNWHKHGGVFATMGLAKQQFVAVDGNDSQVIVDPQDLSKPKNGPFTVRRDFVEFVATETDS